MNTSKDGRVQIIASEGNPTVVYLDPVGIPTVGPGLAQHNPVVKRMLGTLVPGQRIPREKLDRVFGAVLAEYVDPAIRKGMPNAKQHEFDAGADMVFNCGPGCLNWNWAKLWRDGKVGAAAQYLATHYNTAKGKVFRGLTLRRQACAKLLENGIYAHTGTGEGVERKVLPKQPAKPDTIVIEAQQLLTARGFNPGAIDGWMGRDTKKAILAYQKAHPHLLNDGILGKATLTQLRRDAEAAKTIAVEIIKKGGGGSLFGFLAALFSGISWGWIVAVIVLAALGWAVWRYRDVIARRWNTAIGKTVVV